MGGNRSLSSAGRALRSHRRGRWFESSSDHGPCRRFKSGLEPGDPGASPSPASRGPGGAAPYRREAGGVCLVRPREHPGVVAGGSVPAIWLPAGGSIPAPASAPGRPAGQCPISPRSHWNDGSAFFRSPGSLRHQEASNRGRDTGCHRSLQPFRSGSRRARHTLVGRMSRRGISSRGSGQRRLGRQRRRRPGISVISGRCPSTRAGHSGSTVADPSPAMSPRRIDRSGPPVGVGAGSPGVSRAARTG